MVSCPTRSKNLCRYLLHTQITNFVSQTLHVFGFNRAVGRSKNSRGLVVLSKSVEVGLLMDDDIETGRSTGSDY